MQQQLGWRRDSSGGVVTLFLRSAREQCFLRLVSPELNDDGYEAKREDPQ